MRKFLNIKLFIVILLALTIPNVNFAQDTTTVKHGKVKVQTSQKIKELIAKKRHYNKSKKYIQGFKIQLFYGSEQAAIKVKDKFDTVFIDIESMLDFDSPYWKVIVGNYKTRLEADRALVEIKDGFPSAIIIPFKVKI